MHALSLQEGPIESFFNFIYSPLGIHLFPNRMFQMGIIVTPGDRGLSFYDSCMIAAVTKGGNVESTTP